MRNLNVCEKNVMIMPFFDNLRGVKSLDQVVNSKDLPEDFQNHIDSFQDSYMELCDLFQLQITNKIHIIISPWGLFQKELKISVKNK